MVTILRLISTIYFLKPIQIWFQFYYRVRKQVRRITNFKYTFKKTGFEITPITLVPFIYRFPSYVGEKKFTFLNLEKKFSHRINWDFKEYGKLWTYNLNYFDFINQKNSVNLILEYEIIINEFINELPTLQNANEPFPTSLRIINLIKFITTTNKNHQLWNESIYAQLYILDDQIEFHLLGNHLLENSFALTIGGLFFNDQKIYSKGIKLLLTELKNQILIDGAHFELSPMYHSIMLERLLDCINFMQNRKNELNKEELYILINYAEKMLAWQISLTFQNGYCPNFNDSSPGIASETNEIVVYAERLGIKVNPLELGDSGYRRITNPIFDVIAKCGKIGPDYQPGHSHADGLSFELQIQGQPFLVDPGISTYENNKTRQKERGTAYHNTVIIEEKNSSEVWSAFRVGRREYSNLLFVGEDKIRARRLDYNGQELKREWQINERIRIIDDVGERNASLNLHFYPGIELELISNMVKTQNANICFEGATSVSILEYYYCEGFNKRKQAQKLKIDFKGKLITEISRGENSIFNG